MTFSLLRTPGVQPKRLPPTSLSSDGSPRLLGIFRTETSDELYGEITTGMHRRVIRLRGRATPPVTFFRGDRAGQARSPDCSTSPRRKVLRVIRYQIRRGGHEYRSIQIMTTL